MDLNEMRARIDEIDDGIVELFMERMNTVLDVAKFKRESGIAVSDRSRERDILCRVSEESGELARYARALFGTLFDVSKSYQRAYLGADDQLKLRIERAIQNTASVFPPVSTAACQGIEGAYSQQACERMIESPSILYFENFDAVFSAVEKGLCRYGVLPIENSSAGTVSQVYDLMEKHKFHIARGVRQRLDHALMAPAGATISSIREVYSHPQAIAQCGEFLKAHPEMRVTTVSNTAVAASMVAAAGRSDLAAISSSCCSRIYGLDILSGEVSDANNNYTRFIAISRDLEIYPGAGKISMSLSLPHQPGALGSLLSRFSSMNVNLTKLESRPVPGREFEFRFYFDIEASAASPEIVDLLCDVSASCEQFTFLGNYQEIY